MQTPQQIMSTTTTAEAISSLATEELGEDADDMEEEEESTDFQEPSEISNETK